MLEIELCCEILLLLNMADMGRLLCKTGVSKPAEYLNCSFKHMDRLSACREFCGVHGLQNGTRCSDGVKVLWCHSHLVWLAFEAFIPTSACFHEGKLFVTCFCCFFFLFCIIIYEW